MSEPSIPEQIQHGESRRERRAVLRFCYFAQALGHASADPVTVFFEGRILDLSANGVGLRIQRQLAPGAAVSLTLKHTTGIFQCERSARVVHTRPEGEGSWLIGCEFTVPLTPTEIRWFQVQDFARPDSAS